MKYLLFLVLFGFNALAVEDPCAPLIKTILNKFGVSNPDGPFLDKTVKGFYDKAELLGIIQKGKNKKASKSTQLTSSEEAYIRDYEYSLSMSQPYPLKEELVQILQKATGDTKNTDLASLFNKYQGQSYATGLWPTTEFKIAHDEEFASYERLTYYTIPKSPYSKSVMLGIQNGLVERIYLSLLEPEHNSHMGAPTEISFVRKGGKCLVPQPLTLDLNLLSDKSGNEGARVNDKACAYIKTTSRPTSASFEERNKLAPLIDTLGYSNTSEAQYRKFLVAEAQSKKAIDEWGTSKLWAGLSDVCAIFEGYLATVKEAPKAKPAAPAAAKGKG